MERRIKLIASLSELDEGKKVECIENQYSKNGRSNVWSLVFEKGKMYEIVRLEEERQLAVVKVQNNTIVAYCILPDQRYNITNNWAKFNAAFKVIN